MSSSEPDLPELPDSVRELAGRLRSAGGLSAGAHARIAQRLAAETGPGGGSGSGGGGVPASPSGVAPALLGAGLVTVALVGAFFWMSSQTPVDEPARVDPATSEGAGIATLGATPVPVPAPDSTEPRNEPAGPVPQANDVGEERADAESVRVEPDPADDAPRARRAVRVARPSPEPTAQAAEVSPPDDVTPDSLEEASLVLRARRAVRGAPAQALALCDRHAERFPDGQLVQEREIIRIDATRALGREDQARTMARAFLAAHPRSPSREHLRWALDD